MKTTINIVNCIKGLVGLASIALIIPASAIENPAAEEAPKAKGNKAAAAEVHPDHGKKEVKKVAMLGLGGSPASDTLSLHLGLGADSGLVIYHVVPGSAAAKAGLESHDVLTHFDGKKVRNQNDLREAVLARKPGDEVTIKYIHKGKAEEKKVVLGERNARPRVLPEMNMERLLQGMGNVPEADRKLMQAEMRKHFQRMQKQLQGGGINFQLGGDLKGGMESSVTMMDDQGSVTMKTVDGKQEVIVKDKTGKVVFEGPYQTEQDKAAVPDDIRDRLNRLNFGEKVHEGLRLQVFPGHAIPDLDERPMQEEPIQPDEDDAAE